MWDQVQMKNYTSVTNRDLFHFDWHGRLVSNQITNYCLGPQSNNVFENVILRMNPCRKSTHSWQITNEGRLMFSGSEFVLDYSGGGGANGDKLKLRKRASRLKQLWILDKHSTNSGIEIDDHLSN